MQELENIKVAGKGVDIESNSEYSSTVKVVGKSFLPQAYKLKNEMMKNTPSSNNLLMDIECKKI
jgi:hypothetical protein